MESRWRAREGRGNVKGRKREGKEESGEGGRE